MIKAISSSQLTGEVGGTLVYDHDEWIEVRIAFEQFIWDALDVLDKLHDIEQKIVVDAFASDQDGAKVNFLIDPRGKSSENYLITAFASYYFCVYCLLGL